MRLRVHFTEAPFHADAHRPRIFRYALRTLARTPASPPSSSCTLGLGIGANTAIFSLMDQVLLRLLPVKHAEQLVQLDGPGPFSGRTENDRTFSYPMYLDFRDRNDVFDGTVARGAHATLPQRGQASAWTPSSSRATRSMCSA